MIPVGRTIGIYSYRLSEKGVTGGSVPVEMDDGGRLVAVLDPKHQIIALAFGRNGNEPSAYCMMISASSWW